jgi:lipoyl(octanoyl) transferase
VPCGIATKGVTSLSQELGRSVDIEEVKKLVLGNLCALFEFNQVNVSRETLPNPV